jgi:PAS domain S-box-containing protein
VKINITPLVISLFLAVSLISIGIVSYVIYSSAEKTLTNEVYDRLTTVSNSKGDAVKIFLQNQKITTGTIAVDQIFKDLLSLDKNDPAYAEKLQKTRNRLVNILESNPNYYHNFLIDKNGMIVASNNLNSEGINRSDYDYFIEGKKGVFFKDAYVSDLSGETLILISAPVLNEKKELLGVYGATIKLDTIAGIISKGGGLGETGESFLINDQGYMITPSKYEKNVVLVKKIDTMNSRDCLRDIQEYHKNNNQSALVSGERFDVFKDYRNVNVLGTHSYLTPEADWCLTAKIDESEALGIPRKEIQSVVIWISAIMALFVFVSSYLVSKLIAHPIKKLTKKVDDITKGDLNIQLESSSINEMQILTDSLNRILASLKLAILRSGVSKEDLGIGEAIRAKEEAEERYRNIYESSEDAMMILEPPEWKFTAGNKATLKMFKIKNEKQLTSLGPWDISPKYQPDGKLSSTKAEEMIKKALKEGVNYFEWTHKRTTGEEFTVTILLSRMRVGGKDIIQSTVRELTTMKGHKKNKKA